MIWLYPTAAFALVALAAPVLVHILARQRASRVPFPTLRFIHPHRLASIRRRALDEAMLLVVRAAVLTAAAAAIAGPLLMTEARRRAWNAQTIRAEATDPDVAQGLVRAVTWLARQAPGRREIVVRGALTIGSITDADIQAIPKEIGIRFERTVTLPSSRSIRATPVVVAGKLIDREIALNGDRTSVRDVAADDAATASIEVVAFSEHKAAADRLRATFASERAPAALSNQSARVAFASSSAAPSQISIAWMADASARIARDVERIDASSEVVDLVFGSEGNRLVVITPMTPIDSRALELLRAVARSLAPRPDRAADEIVPIADARLRAWSREPGPAPAPTREMIDHDDRRWPWALVLALIALEWWMRRARHAVADTAGDSSRAA